MIDHITVKVRDLAASKAFYEQVLATLGMQVNLGSAEACFWGFGPADAPEFEIAEGRFFVAQDEKEHQRETVHVAFRAKNQEVVQAFYTAALSTGGKDNGPPGPRPHYTENYYAAFVLDPDGNNIECVTFSS